MKDNKKNDRDGGNLPDDMQVVVSELTADLKRSRADFENFRKRADSEKSLAFRNGQAAAVKNLLPVIDTIDRAIAHVPEELAENRWAQGVVALQKNVEKSLKSLKLERINTSAGVRFDPNFHEAVQFDETAVGDVEVVEEELQPGYLYDGEPLRHAMVKVTRK